MSFSVKILKAHILNYDKKQYIGFLMEEVALVEINQTLVNEK